MSKKLKLARKMMQIKIQIKIMTRMTSCFICRQWFRISRRWILSWDLGWAICKFRYRLMIGRGSRGPTAGSNRRARTPLKTHRATYEKDIKVGRVWNFWKLLFRNLLKIRRQFRITQDRNFRRGFSKMVYLVQFRRKNLTFVDLGINPWWTKQCHSWLMEHWAPLWRGEARSVAWLTVVWWRMLRLGS